VTFFRAAALLWLSAGIGVRAEPQRAADGAAEQVAPKTRGYVVPRTPWGDPDLNGVWPSIDMVRVPLQRAPQYGARLFMTAEEHAALEKREQEQIVRMANDGAGGATGAPGHWVEWGKSQLQTSLLIDPPDGRMPSLTPEGQARTAAAPREMQRSHIEKSSVLSS
jgi:hypothetical protein